MLPEVKELISSNGNIRLAAERSGKPIGDFVQAILDSDPDAVVEAAQLSLLLTMLDLVGNYKVALIAALGDMTERDIANSFISLLEQTQGMLGNNKQPSSSPVNFFNYLKQGEEIPFSVKMEGARQLGVGNGND